MEAGSQQNPVLQDPAHQTEVISEVARLLEAHYVFPDRGAASAEAIRAAERAGRFLAFTEPHAFAEALTSALVELTADAHMVFRVVEATELKESTTSALHHPIRLSRLAQDEHLGFRTLSWHPGRVGYLELIRVNPLSQSREMMDAAMLFLSEADAVIIDLRENGGGAGESLPYLCSFFLEGSVQLTGYYSREDNFLKEFWTLAEVDGGALSRVPLFLLTGPGTFSAAEMLAYDLQALHRATVVGEPSGGGAASVDLFPVGRGFELYLSTSTAVSPVTGGNWEGVGVVPDVRVPVAEAMDTALVLAARAARDFAEAREAGLATALGPMEEAMARAEALFGEGDEAGGVRVLDSLFLEVEEVGFMTEFFMDILAYPYFSPEHGPLLLALLNERLGRFPSVESHERLGLAYRILGDPAEALRYYEEALALDPANRNAAKWIRRLKEGG